MAGESLTDGRCVSAPHAHKSKFCHEEVFLGKREKRLGETHCRYDNNSWESIKVMEREVSH